MKTTHHALICASLAAALLFVLPTAWAQMNEDEETYDAPSGGTGMMPPGHMGQSSMTTQMSAEHLKQRLGLTDEQTAKLKELRRTYLKETVMQTAKIKVAELELGDLLDDKKLDLSKIEKKIKEAEALRSELTLSRVRSLMKSADFLTPEQFEKLRAMTVRRLGANPHGPMGPMEKGKMGPPSSSNPHGGQGMAPGQGMMPEPMNPRK
jgi:Spy/CpxP family protein refolding chaperone